MIKESTKNGFIFISGHYSLWIMIQIGPWIKIYGTHGICKTKTMPLKNLSKGLLIPKSPFSCFGKHNGSFHRDACLLLFSKWWWEKFRLDTWWWKYSMLEVHLLLFKLSCVHGLCTLLFLLSILLSFVCQLKKFVTAQTSTVGVIFHNASKKFYIMNLAKSLYHWI